MRTVPPVTPGEMLEEEFLKPLGLTKYRLAKDIGVPAQRIGEIVAGGDFAPAEFPGGAYLEGAVRLEGDIVLIGRLGRFLSMEESAGMASAMESWHAHS